MLKGNNLHRHRQDISLGTMEKNLNMREVARQANVSVATVSRALRSPDKVAAPTVARVQAAAESLGYVYNATAGDILKGRSTVIGLLVPAVGNALFGETLHGIQDVALAAGYSVIQGTTRYNETSEAMLVDSMLQRRVHALILTGMTYNMEARIQRLASEAGLRVVVVWEKPVKGKSISYVGFDNRDAARRMTEHLVDLGHHRIGLIAGPYSRVGRARCRLEGYRDALQGAGIPFDPDLVIERHPDLLDGREAMEALMALPERPSAVFATSDLLAIGALKAARSLGLSVPGDVSVSGFDDLDVVAYMNPPLTTMRVDAYRIGQLAAQVAIEPAGNPARHYCLDSDLVLRGSVGPCPKGT